MDSRSANCAWWRVGMLSILSLITPVTAADNLWSKLSTNEQANIVKLAKQEMAAYMRNPASGILPVLPDGTIDPNFLSLANKLAEPGNKTISQHAGELVAYEYRDALRTSTNWALTELVSSFRDNTLKKFEANSVSRVYLEYLGSKSAVWTSVIKASLDSRNSWTDVGALAWEQLNAQAGKDLQNMQKNALEKLLSDAVGNWASLGYVQLLQAEIAYIGEVEKIAVIISADNYYQLYRKHRDQTDADQAFDYTMDYLIGESGWQSIFESVRQGSVRSFRAGSFVLNHVESWQLKKTFESCYQALSPVCRVEAQDLYSKNPGDWQGIRNEMNKTRAQLRLEFEQAGGLTRNHLSTVYAHLGEILRKKAYAAYQATEGEQAELARIRNDIAALLERIRQIHSTQSSYPGIARAGLSALETAYAASQQALKDAERIPALGLDCAKGVVQEDLQGIDGYSRAVVTHVRTADSASTAACDYGDPRSLPEAERIRDDSRRENERVRLAARSARAALTRLARQIAATGEIQLSDNPARNELETLLDRLEGVNVFAQARQQYERLAELDSRSREQSGTAYNWLKNIEALARPWKGVPDIDIQLDEALRLYGRGPYIEATQNIEAFTAAASARFNEAATPARIARRTQPYFEKLKQEGWDALAACKSRMPSENVLIAQLDDTEDKLETSTLAADLCLARAQLLVDKFSHPVSSGENSGNEADKSSSTVEPDSWASNQGGVVESDACDDPGVTTGLQQARIALDLGDMNMWASAMQPVLASSCRNAAVGLAANAAAEQIRRRQTNAQKIQTLVRNQSPDFDFGGLLTTLTRVAAAVEQARIAGAVLSQSNSSANTLPSTGEAGSADSAPAKNTQSASGAGCKTATSRLKANSDKQQAATWGSAEAQRLQREATGLRREMCRACSISGAAC